MCDGAHITIFWLVSVALRYQICYRLYVSSSIKCELSKEHFARAANYPKNTPQVVLEIKDEAELRKLSAKLTESSIEHKVRAWLQ